MPAFTEAQRKVIDMVNFLLEDNQQDSVDVTDVYTSTDMTFEEINDAIESCPALAANADGVIVSCPDRVMMNGASK